MKTIALAALLAVGCSKQTADCESSIAKGIGDLTTAVESRAVNARMQERIASALGTLKATLIKRCTEDTWAPEARACFSHVPSMKGLQDCEAKLTVEQRKKVAAERRSLMRASGGPRMSDIPAHPETLTGAHPVGAGAAAQGAPGDRAMPAPPPASPPPASAGSAAPAPPPAPAGSPAPAPGW